MEEAGVSAVFFSGRPFPVCEEAILQVGGSLLWRLVGELSGKSEQELTQAYRKLGDLGAVAARYWDPRRVLASAFLKPATGFGRLPRRVAPQRRKFWCESCFRAHRRRRRST